MMEKSNSVVMEQKSKIPVINFDKMAEELGGLGRYQIMIYLFGCFASFVSGLSTVSTVFTSYNSAHRCYIQECDSPNSSYEEPFLNFTIPYSTKVGMYEECSAYESDVNNSETTNCDPLNFDPIQTTNCTQWVYDKELFTSTAVTTFDLVCDRAFLVPLGDSAYLLGMLIGSFAFGVITDKYGRKVGFLSSSLVYGLSGVGSAGAPNYALYLVLRVFTGIGSMAVFQVAFIIVIELVGSKWRTFCGTMIQIPFALGEVFTGVLAYFIKDWRWLQVMCTAPSFLVALYYWFVPESIRWLMSQNRIDDAERVIDRVAEVNKIPSPSHLLRKESENKDVENDPKTEDEMFKKKSMFNLLKAPNMRKRSLILFFCWSVCALNYFGLSSNSGNLSGNIFINYILMMLVEIPSYLAAYYLLDNIGRKGTLMAVFMLGGAACVISGLVPSELEWFITSLSLLGKSGSAGAFGAIFVYTAELYPTEYRNVGVGTCSMCSRIGGIFGPFVSSLSTIYQPLPLLIFGMFSFFAGCLVFLLPETLGSELPQTVEESEALGKDQALFYFTFCGRTSESRKDSESL